MCFTKIEFLLSNHEEHEGYTKTLVLLKNSNPESAQKDMSSSWPPANTCWSKGFNQTKHIIYVLYSDLDGAGRGTSVSGSCVIT